MNGSPTAAATSPGGRRRQRVPLPTGLPRDARAAARRAAHDTRVDPFESGRQAAAPRGLRRLGEVRVVCTQPIDGLLRETWASIDPAGSASRRCTTTRSRSSSTTSRSTWSPRRARRSGLAPSGRRRRSPSRPTTPCTWSSSCPRRTCARSTTGSRGAATWSSSSVRLRLSWRAQQEQRAPR